MSRYLVIGAGAIGATLAAELHLIDIDVTVVARGANLAALRSDGLRYICPDGQRVVPLRVIAGPDEVELRTDDVLVLATKAQDADAAISQWAGQPVGDGRRAAGEVLPILVLQNGLDAARSALRRFATVFDAVTMSASSHLRAGEVVSPAAPIVGALYIGRPERAVYPLQADGRLDQVAADLRRARFAVELVDEVARWKAGKLLGNLAYNLDALYAPSPLRDLAGRAVAEEARRVLRADGIEPVDIQNSSSLDLTDHVLHTVPGHERPGSSTWQSVARAGGLESDFLYGEIVLRARLSGVAAPLNAAIQSRFARLSRDRGAPGGLGDLDLATTLPTVLFSGSTDDVFVDANELHDELSGEIRPVLLDVRWALGDSHGIDHYRDAHLPGAIYVDLESELAASPAALAGRHPLPDIDTLQAAARRWGLNESSRVVVYDGVGGLSAARAWWLLRWAGIADVRILDGSLAAWIAAGFETQTGDIRPEPGDVTLRPGHLPVLTDDEAAALPASGVLLDARAAERYRGEVEPIDSRAGHIPGALSAPAADNLNADQTLLTRAVLQARFGELGVSNATTVGVYCGSGVTAAHQVAALASVGITAALYPGSWSAWSCDAHRPVATGPDSGRVTPGESDGQ